MAEPDWSIVFLLPDIVLSDGRANAVLTSLALDGIALAPEEDDRVRSYLDWSPVAKRLIGAFRTEYGTLQPPTFLIADRQTLNRLGKRPDPIIAFRNAIAIACILHNRSLRGHPPGPTWTDSFDHHPAEITLDGKRVDVRTPALTSWGLPLNKLIISRDAGLPLAELRSGDDMLAVWLGRAWRHTYLSKRNVRRGRRLFRSLELAYLAASMRSRNYNSLHEVGVSTVLWVSAIETLAAPNDRKARRLDGHSLISEHDWGDFQPALNSKRYRVVEHTRSKKSFLKVNLATKIYDYLYSARSKFVHGDKVRAGLLLPFGKRPAPPLLALASTVYRTALTAYLQRHWPWSPSLEERVSLGIFSSSYYSRHLLLARGDDGY